MDTFDDLHERAKALGYIVIFRRFVEDSLTPGFPGRICGRTDTDRKEIVISTHWGRDDRFARSHAEQRAIFEHELIHAGGALHAPGCPEFGLFCGGHREANQITVPALELRAGDLVREGLPLRGPWLVVSSSRSLLSWRVKLRLRALVGSNDIVRLDLADGRFDCLIERKEGAMADGIAIEDATREEDKS